MTKQLEAILMIARHPALEGVLVPAIDVVNEEIRWENISVGGLSGGQRAALSWAFCIWTDGQIPKQTGNGERYEWSFEGGWRDPFEGFGTLDRDLQLIILAALAHRHGTTAPMGELETYLRSLSRWANSPLRS